MNHSLRSRKKTLLVSLPVRQVGIAIATIPGFVVLLTNFTTEAQCSPSKLSTPSHYIAASPVNTPSDSSSSASGTTSIEWQALCSQGEAALEQQHPQEAEALFKKALALANKISPDSAEAAKCHIKLADALTLRTKVTDAVVQYQEALAILTKRYGNNSKEIVPVLFSLGSIQESLGNHTAAIAYYQRALHINEKSYGEYSPAFAENLRALGRANAHAGKRREAEKNYKQAMSILLTEPSLGASEKLQGIMHDYSDLLQKDDDSDHSLIKDFKEDVLNEKVVSPSGRSSANTPLLNLAPSHGGGGNDATIPGASSATELPTGMLNNEAQAAADSFVNNGSSNLSAWQAQSSVQQRSLSHEQTNEDSQIQLRGLAEPWSNQTLSPAYRVVQNSIADRNRYGHGEDYYQRMIAVDIDSLGPHHPSVANDLKGLAQFYIGESQYLKAEPLLKRAYDIYLQTYGSNNLLTIDTLASLAKVQSNLGDNDKAVDLYKTALSHCQSTFGPNHLETARLLNELAYLYFHEGKLQESRTLYGLAVTSTEASVGTSSPWLAACLRDYAKVLRSLGQITEAQTLENRADSILSTRKEL